MKRFFKIVWWGVRVVTFMASWRVLMFLDTLGVLRVSAKDVHGMLNTCDHLEAERVRLNTEKA